MRYPLIDNPAPLQSISMPPLLLTNEELIDCFESVVQCQHYCPVKCNHDRDFSFDDLYKELLRRMENGEKYETLSD